MFIVLNLSNECEIYCFIHFSDHCAVYSQMTDRKNKIGFAFSFCSTAAADTQPPLKSGDVNMSNLF